MRRLRVGLESKETDLERKAGGDADKVARREVVVQIAIRDDAAHV